MSPFGETWHESSVGVVEAVMVRALQLLLANKLCLCQTPTFGSGETAIAPPTGATNVMVIFRLLRLYPIKQITAFVRLGAGY